MGVFTMRSGQSREHQSGVGSAHDGSQLPVAGFADLYVERERGTEAERERELGVKVNTRRAEATSTPPAALPAAMAR